MIVMIKCVIFDFGDTLVNSGETNKTAFDAYMRKIHSLFNNKYSMSEIIKAKEEAEIDYGKLDNVTRLSDTPVFENIFLGKLGEKPDKKLGELIASAYWDTKFEKVSLFPRTKETLEHLKGQGLILCVITNTKTDTNRRLAKKLGIFKYFDYFLMSHEFGSIKSELKIFHHLLEQVNKKNKILPSECLMVGNDLEEDTVAKKIGMKTVILTKEVYNKHPEKMIKPDYYIKELIELKEIIEKS